MDRNIRFLLLFYLWKADYPGLPKAGIARVHENRFKPEKLFKFINLKGLDDSDRTWRLSVQSAKNE